MLDRLYQLYPKVPIRAFEIDSGATNDRDDITISDFMKKKLHLNIY